MICLNSFEDTLETKAMVFYYTERGHPLVKEYMSIRDYHYSIKNKWESHTGEDAYDPHSIYLLVVHKEQVMVGCRIIKDEIDLPVRELLREQGLPTSQIPEGSCEISRLAINPVVLGSRQLSRMLVAFTEACSAFGEMHGVDRSYGVLISGLHKWFRKQGSMKIEELSQPATTRHGESSFTTVSFTLQ